MSKIVGVISVSNEHIMSIILGQDVSERPILGH